MKTLLRSSVVERKSDALTADAGLDRGAVSGSAARSTGSYSLARLGRSITIATGIRVASTDADTDAIAKAKPNRATRRGPHCSLAVASRPQDAPPGARQ